MVEHGESRGREEKGEEKEDGSQCQCLTAAACCTQLSIYSAHLWWIIPSPFSTTIKPHPSHLFTRSSKDDVPASAVTPM